MTLFILLLTCLVSIICFYKKIWFERLQFNAYQIVHNKQYYRLFTHGFVHAGWMHLLINMLVFYSFGQALEYTYEARAFGGVWSYLLLYLLALPVSSVFTLKKQKDNPLYNAVGASGAVNAVVFAYVFLDPWNNLLLFFALPIPGFVFALFYLIYTYIMSKKENDGVGHDAHLWGAVFGMVFTALMIPGSLRDFFVHLFKLS